MQNLSPSQELHQRINFCTEIQEKKKGKIFLLNCEGMTRGYKIYSWYSFILEQIMTI